VDEKQLIRDSIRAARQAIPAEERTILSAQACGRLLGLPEVLAGGTVLGYYATHAELDPAAALASLRANGAMILLPRIVGIGALTLHVVGPLEGLEHGPHGVRQPSMRAPEVSVDRVSMAIVPGVAFAADGARIGYGGGYYDRLLASMPEAIRLGIAYDQQLVGSIPHEPHDCDMHAIVTPTQVIRCSGEYRQP